MLFGTTGLDDKDQSLLILLWYQTAYKKNYRYFIAKSKSLCYNAFKICIELN